MKTISIKNNFLRNAITIVCVCVLFALPASVNAQLTQESPIFKENMPRQPFDSGEAPGGPLRANPGGDGQKQETPILEGLWLLTGLAMSYGIFCRRRRKE